MADIVNLRLARKRKERQRRETAAAGNRVRHGRSKSERKAAEHAEDAASRLLDGHRRDRRDDREP